jgi:DNA polymerase-3 subunit gamma/tau
VTDQPFVSLYRRFRPGKFGEVRGQDHVVRALQGAVRDDRAVHAYLFSGPRGTGKTSTARILAKALNCEAAVDGEPCGVCTSCLEIALGNSLDVHELDAASNNGVDAMRDLVAHAALGTPGRWKIYIVDEVHMLSTAAANALLKTLEEPPSHVVFVLATTDPQKVPPTIRSRTQHLEFRLLGGETLHELLESVKEQAGLDLSDDSIDAAVRRGRGSARDALSALDQIAASGSSDSARPELHTVLTAMAENEAGSALVGLNALLAGGWGPQQLATELVDDLRQVFLVSLAPELAAVTGQDRERSSVLAQSMGLPQVVRCLETIGKAIVDMRDAPDPQVVLEMALVRSTRPDLNPGIEALVQRVEALERSLSTGAAPPSISPQLSAPIEQPIAAAEPTTPSDGTRRPSLGAIRRQRSDARSETPAAPSVLVEAEPELPRPEAASPSPVVNEASRSVVDRDSLTQAWGDGLLGKLPARVKAAFSAGWFVSAAEDGARFALPNPAHRDHCAPLVPTVEQALSAHFGTSVRLILEVRESGDAPTSAPSGSNSETRASGVSVLADDDAAEHMDLLARAERGGNQELEAEARLLQAFPGTTEVST